MQKKSRKCDTARTIEMHRNSIPPHQTATFFIYNPIKTATHSLGSECYPEIYLDNMDNRPFLGTWNRNTKEQMTARNDEDEHFV